MSRKAVLRGWWAKITPMTEESIFGRTCVIAWLKIIYRKRVHDKKKLKALRTAFREKLSWKVYCWVAYGRQQHTLRVVWSRGSWKGNSWEPCGLEEGSFCEKACGWALMLAIAAVLSEGYYSKVPARGRILSAEEIEISDSGSDRGAETRTCISALQLMNGD